jgi:hypothetical protein
MNKTVLAVIVAMAGLSCAAIASGQTIQMNVMYVCNGERIEIDSCNIRDTSDTSKCMVGHPDTVLPNGLMKYTYETRGDLKKLLATCKQPSSKDVASAQAFNKKIQDQQDAAIKRAAQSNPYAVAAPAAQPAEDPQTRAMYRCVEAGRDSALCLGNGLMNSIMPDVNNLLSSAAPGVVGKEVPGPEMSGLFTGGGWRMEFSGASVGMSCGGAQGFSRAYTVSIVSNHAIINISLPSGGMSMLLNGDTLSSNTGLIIGGKKCMPPVISSKGAGMGAVDAKQQALMSMLGGDSSAPPPTGLRMNGTFAAASGFSVGFYPESAIVGCGPDAARAYPYTVVADGRGAYVKVAAPQPLTLVLRGNNMLDPGSGKYLVQGRKITGQTDNGDYTFAPLNATCSLAMLAPGAVPSVIR